MRTILALALLAGCPSEDTAMPADARIDATQTEFFGEPCTLPPPRAVQTCHCIEWFPDGGCRRERGFCVDEANDGVGVCRPWCTGPDARNGECVGQQAGGIATLTTNDPTLCYCRPPQ